MFERFRKANNLICFVHSLLQILNRFNRSTFAQLCRDNQEESLCKLFSWIFSKLEKALFHSHLIRFHIGFKCVLIKTLLAIQCILGIRKLNFKIFHKLFC